MILDVLTLMKDKDLHPEIKGYLHQQVQGLKAYLKKAKKTNSLLLKAHFSYCASLLE